MDPQPRLNVRSITWGQAAQLSALWFPQLTPEAESINFELYVLKNWSVQFTGLVAFSPQKSSPLSRTNFVGPFSRRMLSMNWTTLAETALYLPLSLQTTTSLFTFWHQRVTPETCDLWDIWSEWWGDMTWPKKDNGKDKYKDKDYNNDKVKYI